MIPHLLLALAAPSGETLLGGATITALGAAAAAIIRAHKTMKQARTITRIEPDPLNVRKAPEFVPRAEFEKFEGEVRDFIYRMDSKMTDERNLARITAGKIHQRIDETQGMVREVKGTLTSMSGVLTQILQHTINRAK